MMNLPNFIDNSQYTLASILQVLIKDNHQYNLDIATGFFRIEAWVRLEEAMNQLESFRLLIGRDPTIKPAESDRIHLEKFLRQELQQQLGNKPYNKVYKEQIDRMIAYLQQDHIQVRLFGVLGDQFQFLHAKAYIFDDYSIVGSSNFTPAGINGNTELNILNKDKATARDLRVNWFEKFWNDPSVDVDYKTKLIDTLNASKFGSKPYTPYQIFLKVLYELFKDDYLLETGNRSTLELATFQQEGFQRAIKLIERHGGCIVADAVGLGKTYIGLSVLEYYIINLRAHRYVPRALVICPAQLRDLVWKKKLDEFGIKADIISQEELGRKDFENKISNYRDHDIILVDESHSFRNSSTNRYQHLQRLLGTGKRDKKVLLLTATPINNSVFDLYHQILLLVQNDNHYRSYGISNLKTYFQNLAKGGNENTELLMQTMVRRSRQDIICRQQLGEEILINGIEIKFPQRQLEQLTYNFEDTFQGLYVGFADQIEQLNLSPYNIKSFKKRQRRDDKTEIKRNKALVALQKTFYLKRLESSIIAFSNSIKNQKDFQTKFYQILVEGKLLDSKNFRKLVQATRDEDAESAISEIIDNLDTINPNDYKIEHLQADIEEDLKRLNTILETLNKIQLSVKSGQDSDRKLAAFKELLLRIKEQNEGEKIKVLVFDYYKDTVNYIFRELQNDTAWLNQMDHPMIDIITGETSGKQREEKVKRFSPKANTQSDDELTLLQQKPIDILICTDVLSEGQNLQDAGIMINLSLHWNPVRMIQRAGRIDRLGTDYETLTIYNCFPEEGLENLLNLVKRLQKRIADIDQNVGLDASVLGETISERSLDELYRLKMAETTEDKQAILEELENASDLVSFDEMRLPLLDFIQSRTAKEIEEIPLGIHSTYPFSIPHTNFTEGGLFLAFRAKERHFWRVYPKIKGRISLNQELMITDKRKIFNWLKCQETDFDKPEDLLPVPFDEDIFKVLPDIINQLMEYFQTQATSQKIGQRRIPRFLQPISHLLNDLTVQNEPITVQPFNKTQFVLIEENMLDIHLLIKIKEVIIDIETPKIHERPIKAIWKEFTQHKNPSILISSLNEYCLKNALYERLKTEELEKTIEIIREEDIQLIAYQWFKN